MERKYDLDWLRTIIVLTIIPFHAMIIFNQNTDWQMYVKDTVNVPCLNFIDSIIGRFHMATLFLLAGMAITYSLQHRNAKTFLKQRMIKLFIPLVTGSILLNPIMTYIWSINQGGNEAFPEHYIGFFTKDLGAFDGLTGGYTPAHLWFVLYLLVFSIIGLPIFLWLKSEQSAKFKNALGGFFYQPMTILLLLIPYCFIYFIEILDEKNPIAYFYVVLIGCLFATDNRYIKALNRDRWFYVILTLILYVIYYCFRPSSTASMEVVYLYAFLVKLTKLVPALALMGIFNHYMNKNSQLLQYLSGASYTIYVIHLLVVTIVGFYVIKLEASPYIKLLIIIFLSYAICFLQYELLKRCRYVGILFGTSYKKIR
jgi:Predicted acyltransferases